MTIVPTVSPRAQRPDEFFFFIKGNVLCNICLSLDDHVEFVTLISLFDHLFSRLKDDFLQSVGNC